MWQTYISYSVVDQHIRENSVIPCAADALGKDSRRKV